MTDNIELMDKEHKKEYEIMIRKVHYFDDIMNMFEDGHPENLYRFLKGISKDKVLFR